MIIKDLKKWRVIFFEIGLILSLLIFLAAFKVGIKADKKIHSNNKPEYTLRLPEIPVTRDQTPPAPLKPSVFQPVPDDTPLEDLPDLTDIVWEPDNQIPFPEDIKPDDNEPVPFVKAERKPVLIGGIEALYKKIKYPEKAIYAGIEGIVRIEFTVNAAGKVHNSIVTRSVGGGCDQAALEALEKMSFKPGMQRGNLVPVRMKISVVFRLQN